MWQVCYLSNKGKLFDIWSGCVYGEYAHWIWNCWLYYRKDKLCQIFSMDYLNIDIMNRTNTSNHPHLMVYRNNIRQGNLKLHRNFNFWLIQIWLFLSNNDAWKLFKPFRLYNCPSWLSPLTLLKFLHSGNQQ